MVDSTQKPKETKPLLKVKKEIEELKREFKEKTITLILGGFGLVAALAWNEAIKTLFETLFPKKSEIIGKFLYAIIVTFIVVLVSLQLKKISERRE
jgi:hypothetical protein